MDQIDIGVLALDLGGERRRQGGEPAGSPEAPRQDT